MKSYTSRKTELEPFEFELDGSTFTCTGDLSMLDLGELLRLADFDISHPQSAAAVGDFFLGVMGKDVYAAFRVHCREHGTQPEVLVDILRDMVAHYGNRPTLRPSPSLPGPLTTTTTSADGSSSNGSQPARKRAARGGRSKR